MRQVYEEQEMKGSGESKQIPFRFLEHMSDVIVEAYGRDLKEAFENIAKGMFEVMTDTSKVKALDESVITVEARDKYELLYNWLEELLFKFETEGKVYSKFEVKNIEKLPEGYRLTASAWGESFDMERHPSKVAIKAVTYHSMEIIEGEEVTVRVLFDL